MRCLYCNKKLSLLKLAKGDSFCSPEHFDAHQLQLSKDAIERLMNVPAEDAVREPLVIQQVVQAAEEAHADSAVEENAAIARLTAFSPSESGEAALKPPPYAPFASPDLPYCLVDPPSAIAGGPEGGEAVEGARELAYPVHETESTVCILNLYLGLRLAGTGLQNWTSARHLIVSPDNFRVEISRPRLVFSPVFPEMENPDVAETASPVQAAPAGPSVEPRLPFLMAPSFLARTGTPVRLDGAASSVPTTSTVAPMLDRGIPRRLESCDVLPNATRFAGTTAFHLQDSTAHWIKSDSEIPIQPAFILPRAQDEAREDAWRPTERVIVISRPPVESARTPIAALDYDLTAPASMVVRTEASELEKIDPQELLAGASAGKTSAVGAISLFLDVLETRPLGQAPLSNDLSASATEFAWPARLAPFPSRKAVRAAWEPRTSYFSLPEPLAKGSESAMAPLDPFEYAPACIKMDRIETAELPAPYAAKELYRPIAWPETDFAASPVPAQAGVVFICSTRIRPAANMPAGRLKTGSGAPFLQWEPCRPSTKVPPVVKFLPVRDSARLPEAHSWERLAAVPR